MRIMGLDFGSRDSGGCGERPFVSDLRRRVEIIRRKSPNKLRQTLARIEELITEYEVDRDRTGLSRRI